MQIENLCEERASMPESQERVPTIKINSGNMTQEEKVKNDYNKRLKAIQDLKKSTCDKKRLNKRREIIKSMRFLRLMGKRLREDLANQIKANSKLHRQQTSKLQKLKKQTTRDLQKLWKDQDRNLLGENKQVQQQLKSS
jgi:activator of 2-hydroxyglutaryl-CoA dehydratase